MDSYIPLITNHVLSKKYRKMQEKSSYNNHVDKKLKKHILQYLDSVDDKRLVNSDSIVNELRKTYSDYSRKKRSSFKLAVIKTYNAINNEKMSVAEDAKVKSEQEDTNRDTDGLPESDFSEENENYVFFEDRNSVNKSICDLYNKSTAIKRKLTPKKDEKPVESPIKQREQEFESASFQVETNGVSKKKRKLVAFASEPKDDGVSNVKATKKKEVVPEQTQITFADIGGYEKCLEDVSKILRHLKHPELFVRLGAQPPRGLLLHGPPGCGKTLLAHAISGELQMPLIKVAATEIVAGVSGESEEKIRDLFGKAISSAPCILFIDEIDVITPKRESAQRLMEQRIVAQLLASMDDLNLRNATAQILVIGATNRPDALDPSLRRPGRFDREINLGIPDEKARIRIMKVLCRNLKLEAEFDFAYIARNTPGFVGADLMALKSESVNCAVDRVLESVRTETTQKDENSVSEEQVATSLPTDNNLNCNAKTSLEYELSWLRSQPSLTEQQLLDFFVEMKDFKLGLDIVQPSAKREGFANIPDITWEDIGALSEVREELQFSILAPVRHPEKFKVLGLSSPVGILLCGPPGCGKTLLAKAVANESEVNFISVKGPELLNMYVGESERAVRQCFQRARNSAPCVIFFDELDALCPKRSDSGEGSSGARVVTQLLTEMDGMESRKDVYILGATNRPDVIDPAILRPGRFGKVLYVGLPTGEDRLDILKALTKNGTKPKFEDNICLRDVALDERCNGFTGADLSSLVNEASVAALKEFIAFSKADIEELRVGKRHFECAFKKVVLSVSPRDQQMYERMRLDFTKVRNLESP